MKTFHPLSAGIYVNSWRVVGGIPVGKVPYFQTSTQITVVLACPSHIVLGQNPKYLKVAGERMLIPQSYGNIWFWLIPIQS